MCYQGVGNLLNLPASSWQNADIASAMQHAMEVATHKIKQASAPAMQGVLQNTAKSTPTSYQGDVNTGQAQALTDYQTMEGADPTGRFAPSAQVKSSENLSNLAASKEEGWQHAAVQQFLNNLTTGRGVGTASFLSNLALAPLPAQLRAAQNVDPQLGLFMAFNVLASQNAQGAANSGLFSGGGGGSGVPSDEAAGNSFSSIVTGEV